MCNVGLLLKFNDLKLKDGITLTVLRSIDYPSASLPAFPLGILSGQKFLDAFFKLRPPYAWLTFNK